MRLASMFVLVLALAACGGGDDEPSAVGRGDCVGAWNAEANPHRSAVPETMGVANVSARASGCSYLFHDWGRYVAYSGSWGSDGLEWEGGPPDRGELTRSQQRAAPDTHTVSLEGRLRSLAEASRGWGPRWCRLVGESGGRRYELCREPGRAGPQTRWTTPGTLVVEEAGARTLIHVEAPAGSSDRHPVVGHWERALLSPDGRHLLLQWSAECEVQFTFLADATGGRPRSTLPHDPWYEGPSSVAVGWKSPTTAIVRTTPSCGAQAERRLVNVPIGD